MRANPLSEVQLLYLISILQHSSLLHTLFHSKTGRPGGCAALASDDTWHARGGRGGCCRLCRTAEPWNLGSPFMVRSVV